MADEEALKRRYREFLELMPLTIAIAGLPPSEGQRTFTTEQLDMRAQAITKAYQAARGLARQIVKGATEAT